MYCHVVSAVKTMQHHHVDWLPALRMYRGVFLVILFIFLLGVNTYGWRSSGVNHVLIFELDPRHHLAHQEFMEVFCDLLYCRDVRNRFFLFRFGF